MTTITVSASDYYLNVEVAAGGEDTTTDRVEVFARRDHQISVAETKVSWSSIGSQPPARARRYAQLILEAARIADEIADGWARGLTFYDIALWLESAEGAEIR